MNVANIMPGDDVQVELRYTELLVPQAGNYQFVFPTVVGPRYNSPQSSQATAQWVSQPYLRAGEAGGAAFDIQVAIASPIGLKEVHSTSHTIEVTQQGEERAAVSLQHVGGAQNNRDFILDYRLAGERIESGVMLFRGNDENFFLAMIEPPKQVPASVISPREYIFVVDISGSMHGFPLETSQGAAARADRQPEAQRQLQRAAVFRRQPLPGAAFGAGHPRQHRAGHPHDQPDGRRRQHRADPGAQARVRRAESAPTCRAPWWW